MSAEQSAEKDAGLIDRVLAVLCRIECLIVGHAVASRFAGLDLSAPTCLACGHVTPPERTAD